MKHKLSDRSPEFQQRWREVFAHEWGIYNLASLLMGSGKRQGPGGEIVDDGMRREKRRKTGMTIVVDGNVKCMDCRIGESDGIGGFYCPEKNQELHGKDAETPRKCNYFQPREDDPEIAEAGDQVDEIDEIPEEEKPKKRGPVKKATKYGEKGISIDSIIALHKEGLPPIEIGKKLGCTGTNVCVRLKRAGLTPGGKGKSGGNGKATSIPIAKVTQMKVVELAPPSPVEQAFDELKRSKIDRLKDLLGSFTVAELVEAESVLKVPDLLENVILLAADLSGRKRVAA